MGGGFGPLPSDPMSGIVAFSPIRQSPAVLDLFLRHLTAQQIPIWVYDDNTDPASSELLESADAKKLPRLADLPVSRYRRGDETHHWDPQTVDRVAAIKNLAIESFLDSTFDSLFLIDSDVLIQPGTVEHLDHAQEQVIASVYWTSWHPGLEPAPNLFGEYHPGLKRWPDHYPVGGLGGCTLIRRPALEQLRFTRLPHLETEGEDRWFCHLANQAGIPLTACTHLDQFHIYRESQLDDARAWSDANSRPAQLVRRTGGVAS